MFCFLGLEAFKCCRRAEAKERLSTRRAYMRIITYAVRGDEPWMGIQRHPFRELKRIYPEHVMIRAHVEHTSDAVVPTGTRIHVL